MILSRSVSAFRITKIIKRTLPKKWYRRPTKRHRDIDEFGNEMIVDEED
jgi:hypothetical protein